MPSATAACTLATILLAALSTAVSGQGVGPASAPEIYSTNYRTSAPARLKKDADQGSVREDQRFFSCVVVCRRASSRLCRLCKLASKWPQKFPGWFTTSSPTDETSSEPDAGGDQPGSVVFPDTLPDGTQDAMLETASHILSIVSGEGSEQIRIWLENPERNGDNLDRLAGKLASFPRAPYGRAYWRLVLRSSRDRPFTLLRESLALRKAFQLSGADPGPGSTAPAPGPAPGSKPAGGEETTKEASSEAGSSPEATSTEASASSEGGGGRRGRGLSGTSTSPWS